MSSSALSLMVKLTGGKRSSGEMSCAKHNTLMPFLSSWHPQNLMSALELISPRYSNCHFNKHSLRRKQNCQLIVRRLWVSGSGALVLVGLTCLESKGVELWLVLFCFNLSYCFSICLIRIFTVDVCLQLLTPLHAAGTLILLLPSPVSN